MRRARDPITELRRAIDLLPQTTREAMLEGIRTSPIVVGAYTDDRGGICPMLAAHRHGGRTTLLAFARSWDRFAGAQRVRRATRRELAVLEGELIASLTAAEAVDFKDVIADHEALRARTAAETAVAEPAVGISARRIAPGRLSRLRPRRTAADAERALARVPALSRPGGGRSGPPA